MSKEIPEGLKLNDMSVVLRIQDVMCIKENDKGTCGITYSCDNCILDAPLPEFKAWLVKTLEGIE